MSAKTYTVHTSLHEGADLNILKKRLQHQYPDHQLTQEGDQLVISIPMMSWDETDRDFFNGLYDKKMINMWGVPGGGHSITSRH